MPIGLDDIHDDENDDFEVYDDAAVLQAQKDFMESEGRSSEKTEETASRRSMRFDNVPNKDGGNVDPKWDKFKI
jgi:hypothetical protein